MKAVTCIALILCAVLSHAQDTAPPAPIAIPVGAAKVDITPKFPVRLTGYGNRQTEHEGVAQPIWAKALAIGADAEDGESGGPAVLITVEVCGATKNIVEEVAARLQEKAGIPRERIVVCSTHTHSAPQTVGFAPFIFAPEMPAKHREHVERYTFRLTEMLVEAALAALADRRPATLSWGVGEVGFAGNRRVIQSGEWQGFGVQPDGPVDHRLPVLAARDADGKLIAVVANYACHCTTLGGDFNQVSGDWAGLAMEKIEAEHEGAVALITIGCGADANPKPRGNMEMAREHGESLAAEVARLLKTELTPLSPPLDCALHHIELPLDKVPTKEEFEGQAEQGGQAALAARHFLERIEKGDKIFASVDYPLAAWTFSDDLAMLFLGGEVVVDYALRFDAEFDSKRLWITAYANDVPCYIPSRRILREGGYEADRSMIYYGKPARFSETIEDLISDAAQKVTPARFYSDQRKEDFPPPKSPEEGQAAFRIAPGFRVELAAAEPLIVDPVAFDWGPDGRLWVVEMRDYPQGMDGAGAPGGRVKILTDDDGDGRYDRADLFLDGIPFPTGIKVWRKGALVTAAPEILYAEDEDGDGRADVRRPLYRGFGEGNQQHRVNGLRWGLDNWLYVGNGDSGGQIESLATGEKVDVRGRDVRIEPDSGGLETVSGQTQFGRCRDDWGNWFGGNNSNPMWHYVLDDPYLRRNEHFAPPDVKKQLSVAPGPAPVFPASRTLARFNDHDRANRFTSACSPIIYRDELLTDETWSLVCEPVHNLVHREVVTADGVTFTSRRPPGEEESEFLASTDNWFRPSMVRTGPDGALWVADMYRFVIEHPQWIPADWQARLDLRAGDDRGRIYRVVPSDGEARPFPRLDGLTGPQLVEQLESPNGWVRDTAQELVVQRADKSVAASLEQMVRQGKRPAARLQAMCALDGLDALSTAAIDAALRDEHAGVRRHAVRLAEPRLSDDEALAGAVLALLDDEDRQVQMQLAYSFGEWQEPRAAPALAALAVRHAGDPYFTSAVLSSINKQNVAAVLSGVMRDRAALASQPGRDLLRRLLSLAGALGDSDVLERVVLLSLPDDGEAYSPWQMEALADVLEAAGERRASFSPDAGERIGAARDAARDLAGDSSAEESARLAAIRLLGYSEKSGEAIAALSPILSPREPAAVQLAAVSALARIDDDRVSQALLASWRSQSPSVRLAVIDALLSRPAWTAALLTALEEGSIQTSHLATPHAQRLLSLRDKPLRLRAERILAAGGGSDRAQVVVDFADSLQLVPSAERGKAVFAKRCSQCHRLEEVGHATGPDLAALSDKSPHSLLIQILDPNRAVEDKFIDYVAITADGRQQQGMIESEAGAGLTLVGLEGKRATLLRKDIDELYSTGKSLMPEGMEKDLSRQDVADVIAYIRSVGPPPSEFPGNEPRLVEAGADGSLVLSASDCRIYGPRLVFEQKYKNLGWWEREDDRAVWSLKLPAAGRYRVVLDYACEDFSAGNVFRLRIAGKEITGKIAGTGTWDDYASAEIGPLELSAGLAEAEFRSAGKINGALIDLRSIRLIPVKQR